MKIFKLKYLAVLFISLFLASCDVDQVIEDKIDPNLGENIIFGKIVAIGPLAPGLGKKGNSNDMARPTTLTTNTPWTLMTKDHVKRAGIADNEVFPTLLNKFPQSPIHLAYFASLSSSVYYRQYSTGTRNIHNEIPGSQPVKWRYFGEGTVSQNVSPSPWTRVADVQAVVQKNYRPVGEYKGGTTMLTTSLTKTFTIESNRSGSLTLSASFKIPFVGETTVSPTVTLGSSISESDEKSISVNQELPRIWCPAGKSVRFTFMERWVPVVTTWKVPLEFQGNICIGGIRINNFSFPNYSFKYLASAFNSDYAQPGKFQSIRVTQRLSFEQTVIAEIF